MAGRELIEIEARPATHVRFLVLASACLLAVVTYIHRSGFQTNSPELLRDFGMDVRHLGAMTVAFTIAYGLFEVPWGRFGDRLGARWLLLAIILGGSAMTAAVTCASLVPRMSLSVPWFGSVSTQLLFLLALRFLFGMFQAGTFPVMSRLLADWMPTTERGSAQGLLWMCSRGGGVLAPIFMTWLFLLIGNWKMPLILGAALGLVWAVMIWPWLRNRPEDAPWVSKAEAALIAAGRAQKKPASHGAAPWGAILRSSNIWALWGMYGFLGFSGNFFLFLLANYLQVFRHFTKETTTMLTVSPFVGGLVGCIAGGVLSDAIVRQTGNRRLGRRAVGASGMTLAAVLMACSPWVKDPLWLGILYGFTFLGNDLAMGPAWAAASDIGERHAGTIAGAMNMFASLTAAVMAIVAGQIFHAAAEAETAGDMAGHQFYMVLPFVLFAASYLLGALCWLRVDVTETIPQGHPADDEVDELGV